MPPVHLYSANSLKSLCRWFISGVTRADAEIILTQKALDGHYIHRDGAFLVRQSETSPGEFSLSVRYVLLSGLVP